MNTPLSGSIPGLFRLGSAVATPEGPGVVVAIGDGPTVLVANEDGGEGICIDWPRAALSLDLANGTSRWHAALWIVAESARPASHPALTAAEVELVEQIAWGEDIDAEGIEELRAMALRLVTS